MNSVVFQDNFLPGSLARSFRTAGVTAHYPPDGVHHDGAVYPGMSLTLDSEFERKIADYISVAVGKFRPVVFTASFFRCMLAGQDTAHGHDFRVHFDSSFATHAFVLYLSAPGSEVGGTAFWKHKVLGDNAVSESNIERISEDLTQRPAWQIESLVGMRYNRGVIYPANMIHSAYPQEGGGDTPEKARLIWAALFSCPRN